MKLGRLTRTPLAPGAQCSECNQLYARVGTVRQPAHVVAYVHPSDYEGTNLGPDAPGELPLCWECVGDLLPWTQESNANA